MKSTIHRITLSLWINNSAIVEHIFVALPISYEDISELQ